MTTHSNFTPPATASARRHATQRAPRRAGTVLVFFALLSFVVMGFAALVIDLGMARLTQRQMQAASDTMAVEVLRERDFARNLAEAYDDYTRDHRRRLRNERMASWHFNDELVLGTEGDAEETFGAGIYFEMQQGTGLVNASPRVHDAGFSIPRPRPNYQLQGDTSIPLNLPQGDVVSGTFTGHGDQDEDGVPDGMLGPDQNPFNLEDTQYNRVDFTPAAPEDAPYGSALVARLRRTLPPSSVGAQAMLDDQADISSSGPTFPFLFGLGTTMFGGDPTEGYSPRFHGVKVRATSIAQARPAVRAGVAEPELGASPYNEGSVGVTAFVIQKWLWHAEGGIEVWTDEGDGNYSTLLRYDNGELKCPQADDQSAGFLLKRRLYRVGDRVYRWIGPDADSFWNNSNNWIVPEGYAPVLRRRDTDGPWSDRVVGFVRVRAELLEVPGAGGEVVRFMKLWKLANERAPGEDWIAPRNASALFDGEQIGGAELAEDTLLGESVWSWDILIRELLTLDRAVHGPALVR